MYNEKGVYLALGGGVSLGGCYQTLCPIREELSLLASAHRHRPADLARADPAVACRLLLCAHS